MPPSTFGDNPEPDPAPAREGMDPPPVRPLRRVALLGLGLVGGSMGLALTARRSDLEVVGFDPAYPETAALPRPAVPSLAPSAQEAVRGADLVVIAAPVRQILATLDEVADHLEPGAVVTDVGSVKKVVAGYASEALPHGVHFIPGHPMAGSDRSGLEAADPFLFENAAYVLCPPADLEDGAFLERYAEFVGLLEAIGARVLLLDAERHDRIAAAVSHVPQLLAVALSNFVGDKGRSDPAYTQLAAGGFRDMTRIASSEFGMWEDVLLANHGPVLEALAGLSTRIQRLRNRLIEEDMDAVGTLFSEARLTRAVIPADRKGFLQELSDVFVSVDDRPGAILEFVRILAEAGLNIKDLELLKLREGTGGTFRVGFDNDRDAREASRVLTQGQITNHRLDRTDLDSK